VHTVSSQVISGKKKKVKNAPAAYFTTGALNI